MLSPYAEIYRQRFLLRSVPLAGRLEPLISAFAEERLGDLRRWAKGELQGLVTVLSIQSDINNGLIFLRSLRAAQHFRQSAILAYGDLRKLFWRKLESCRGDGALIGEICRYSPSGLSSSLWEAMQTLKETGSLWKSEFYYLQCAFAYGHGILSRIRGSNGLLVAEYICRLIDLWNLRIWMGVQRREAKGSAADYLRGGKDLEIDQLRSCKNLTALLRGTIWKIPLVVEDNPGLLVSLEKQFFAWQLAQRRVNPLGIHVAMAYMARQLLEWRNLGIILVGLQSSVDRQILLRGLTLLE